MIKCYFGVPGCGKSTILVKEYKRAKRRIFRKYENIYTINIDIKNVEKIDFKDLGKYKFYNSLILIDEITMDADNRDFKNFSNNLRDFFILHRHLGCDIIYATQNFENVDKKIRDLTSELWYMSKSVVPFLKGFTTAKRIYRNININEFSSELTLGYRFCSFIEMLFVNNIKIIWRRPLYKYFNTNEELALSERPLYKNKKEIEYEIQNKTNDIINKLNNIEYNEIYNKNNNTSNNIMYRN